MAKKAVDKKANLKSGVNQGFEIIIEDTSYTEARSRLKYYFDKICEKSIFLKICRYHGENVYVISEKKLLGMSSEEFLAFQNIASNNSGNKKKSRHEAYYEALTGHNLEGGE